MEKAILNVSVFFKKVLFVLLRSNFYVITHVQTSVWRKQAAAGENSLYTVTSKLRYNLMTMIC